MGTETLRATSNAATLDKHNGNTHDTDTSCFNTWYRTFFTKGIILFTLVYVHFQHESQLDSLSGHPEKALKI